MAKAKSAPEAKQPVGRPAFEPTEKQRGEVEALTAAGFNQGEVARYVDIDEKTLRAHFRRELDFAGMKLIGNAVTSLGRMVVGAPALYDEQGKLLRAEIVPELGAVCFLLKTKGKKLGWSERLELTGADGGPIEHKAKVADEIRALLQEEHEAAGATQH